MSRVFVAGSINMDVVATAERHPKIGETVAGNAVLYFPGGKGANQAVGVRQAGRADHADRPANRQRCLRPAIAGVPRRARPSISRMVQGHRRGPHRNGDHHRCRCRQYDCRRPGANALVRCRRCRRAEFAKGDVAVSQFEIPQAAIQRAFFQRARRRARSRFSIPRRRCRIRKGFARSRRYPDPQ